MDRTEQTLPDHITLYPWVVMSAVGDNKARSISAHEPKVVELVDGHLYSPRKVYLEEGAQSLIPSKQGLLGLIGNVLDFNEYLPMPEIVSDDYAKSLQEKLNGEQKDADFLKLATEEQLELSDQLLSVLGEAVRVRVTAQAPVCGKCIARTISKHKLHTSHCVLPTHDQQNTLESVVSTKGTIRSSAGHTERIVQSIENLQLRSDSVETAHVIPEHGVYACDEAAHMIPELSGPSYDEAAHMIPDLSSPARDEAAHVIPDLSGPARDEAAHMIPDLSGPARDEAMHVIPEHSGHACDEAAHVIAGHCSPACDEAAPTISDHAPHCGHARVAVLYSGGIDSLVLAALADR